MSHYDTLGVEKTATPKEIKAAYRMTEQQALERFGAAAQRVEGSCEIRNLPETEEDFKALRPGAGT